MKWKVYKRFDNSTWNGEDKKFEHNDHVVESIIEADQASVKDNTLFFEKKVSSANPVAGRFYEVVAAFCEYEWTYFAREDIL